MKIKDSGTRREFNTGAVRDIQEGKGRCDLMPLDVLSDIYKTEFGADDHSTKVLYNLSLFTKSGLRLHLHNALIEFYLESKYTNLPDMLLELAKHFEEGAKKYGEHNWQKGIPAHCYIDSAVRHFLKLSRGDTDEPHDRAFVWNIICCIWTCKHKPELNDYAATRKEQ